METIFDLYAAILIGLQERTIGNRNGTADGRLVGQRDEETVWLLALMNMHKHI